MSKIKYQATDSRGKVHTRTTTSRVYTHVVVVYLGPSSASRSVVEWAGRHELAQNVARRWDRAMEFRQDIDDIEIVAAERVAGCGS